MSFAGNYHFKYFRHMCILSGCDYLDSIPGIGIKRALTFENGGTTEDEYTEGIIIPLLSLLRQ